ncbi:11327_t:CDS:1, partial [Acaulospora colombiana]
QIEELKVKLYHLHLRLSVSIPAGHANYRHIRITGASQLSAYKSMIDAVLTGEVVTRDGKPLWDNDIACFYGSHIFTENPVPGAQIFVERWQRRIIVYGPDEERARAKRRVMRKFDDAKRSIFIHSFPRHQLRYYSMAVEGSLRPECDARSVWLDTRTCTVTVSGRRAQTLLMRIASNAPKRVQPMDTTIPRDLCPICLDEVTEPQALPCKHRPCRSCLTRYLSSATQSEASFPLRCFGDEGKCNARIPLPMIRRLLNHDQLLSALNRSFELYLHSRPQEYRYCPTSDCPQIYRVRPKSDTPELPEVCISCLARYCPACSYEGGHGGYTCDEHQERMELEKEEEKQIVEGWVRNMGGRSCPKCSMGLLKDGGCAHVQCARCKVHICWTCGKAFEQVADESVYEHMRREHGSIGLIDPDLRNWNEDDVVRELEPTPAAPQTPPRLQQRGATSRSRRNTGAQSLASSAGSSRASTSTQGRGQRNTGKGRAGGRRHEHIYRSSSNRQENGRDSWSEDEDDEFDNTQWDYDFADMDWESMV